MNLILPSELKGRNYLKRAELIFHSRIIVIVINHTSQPLSLDRVSVLGLAVVPLCIGMYEVSQPQFPRSENFPKLLSDRHLCCLIGRGFSPQRDTVLLRTDIHYNATNLIAIVELLTDACEHGMQPIRIQYLCASFGQINGPLPTSFALSVLPLRLYAFTEQVKVTPNCQTARGYDVVVQTAGE